MPSTSSAMRTSSPSCCRRVSQPTDVSAWMNEPMRIALATVPIHGLPPSDHAMKRTTMATAMFAVPNVRNVCFARPWLRTSHGESPSVERRMRTTPSAKMNRPKTKLMPRAAWPPRTRGCVERATARRGWKASSPSTARQPASLGTGRACRSRAHGRSPTACSRRMPGNAVYGMLMPTIPDLSRFTAALFQFVSRRLLRVTRRRSGHHRRGGSRR